MNGIAKEASTTAAVSIAPWLLHIGADLIGAFRDWMDVTIDDSESRLFLFNGFVDLQAHVPVLSLYPTMVMISQYYGAFIHQCTLRIYFASTNARSGHYHSSIGNDYVNF